MQGTTAGNGPTSTWKMMVSMGVGGVRDNYIHQEALHGLETESELIMMMKIIFNLV